MPKSPFAGAGGEGDNEQALRMLPQTLLAISLVALSSAASGGCRVSVEYGETAFACAEGECPGGYLCVQEICLSDEAVDEADAAGSDPADASPPADASEPDAQALAACDDAFAMAPAYELCSEDEASCSFNVTTGGGTCSEACVALGSTCLAAFDNNEIACEPIPATGDTCDTPRNSNICVCARLPL